MKKLLNNTINSVFISYDTELFKLLNDTYLDLDIKGFSSEFCNILQYKYAKTYVDIVTKNTRQYGIDANGVEKRYALKHMRHAFACNKIDIDVLLTANHYEPFIEGVRPQLLNLHLCGEVEIDNNNILNNVLATEYKYPLLNENNNYLTYK